jgi:hypothetical protein
MGSHLFIMNMHIEQSVWQGDQDFAAVDGLIEMKTPKRRQESNNGRKVRTAIGHGGSDG